MNTGVVRRPGHLPVYTGPMWAALGRALVFAVAGAIPGFLGVLSIVDLGRAAGFVWLGVGLTFSAVALAVGGGALNGVLRARRHAWDLRAVEVDGGFWIRHGAHGVFVRPGETLLVRLGPHPFYRSFGRGRATQWQVFGGGRSIEFATFYTPDQGVLDALEEALLERGVELSVTADNRRHWIPGRYDEHAPFWREDL